MGRPGSTGRPHFPSSPLRCGHAAGMYEDSMIHHCFQAWLISPAPHRPLSAPPAGRGKRQQGPKPGPRLHIPITWGASTLHAQAASQTN